MSYDRERAGPCRIYVGNLPEDCDEREVEREFSKFGKVVRCDVKRTRAPRFPDDKKQQSSAPFAFIEFVDPRDAKDAINEKDGAEFMGERLRVEVPFNIRESRGGGGRGRMGIGGGKGSGPPRRGRYLLHVGNLPPSGSWQDLKDHMRAAGEVGHSDVFKDGTGEVSFFNRRDAETAVDSFDGSWFTSHEGEKSRIQVRMKHEGRDSREGRVSYRNGYGGRSPRGASPGYRSPPPYRGRSPGGYRGGSPGEGYRSPGGAGLRSPGGRGRSPGFARGGSPSYHNRGGSPGHYTRSPARGRSPGYRSPPGNRGTISPRNTSPTKYRSRSPPIRARSPNGHTDRSPCRLYDDSHSPGGSARRPVDRPSPRYSRSPF